MGHMCPILIRFHSIFRNKKRMQKAQISLTTGHHFRFVYDMSARQGTYGEQIEKNLSYIIVYTNIFVLPKLLHEFMCIQKFINIYIHPRSLRKFRRICLVNNQYWKLLWLDVFIEQFAFKLWRNLHKFSYVFFLTSFNKR